ncbi:MAG: protein-methionine-sulfoxide reductase catalytic subunit MsrP [Rhodobacteraceae bacterium]|nr:protein-methionine-sulfoxide reductase catalytic subunit MsrP [Paracoccaceae bacterium]
MHYHRRESWMMNENQATDEHLFVNRRQLMVGAAAGVGAGLIGGAALAAPAESQFSPAIGRASGFPHASTPITPEAINSTYNNFYEFGSSKSISQEAQALKTDPWTLTIDGDVEQEITIDIDTLMSRMPMQERVYRHRCVEGWSMVIPWVGFPLKDLVAMAAPLSKARYVRFETFYDTETAPEQKASWLPWPYTESITINEATNDLAMLVVGAYGKVLHKQFGAPLRLHLPWKYGFKSIKSISRITFGTARSKSFWEELNGNEYGFWANVNPEVPHPRWSQATEKPLGQDERVPTALFNGYGEQVAGMYAGMEGDRATWF